jgi:hypothetical protein
VPALVADAVLDTRVQIVAIAAAAVLFGIVIELVRRRRLAERYALLWLIVSGFILVLSIWTGLLRELAQLVGIVPANFLLFAAIGFGFFLLLHFSVAVTRLSEQVKSLAMENARLDQELRSAESRSNGAGPQERAPSSASTPDQ